MKVVLDKSISTQECPFNTAHTCILNRIALAAVSSENPATVKTPSPGATWLEAGFVRGVGAITGLGNSGMAFVGKIAASLGAELLAGLRLRP
jgi:hypothetical protein